jgi:poly(3-hydroxybutyrate) depolymerase
MNKVSSKGRSWISLTCLLVTAACSGGGSESPMAGAPAATPSTPEMPAAPAAPAAAEPGAGAGTTPGSSEGSPLGADLEAPAADGAGSDGPTSSGAEMPAGAPTPAEVGAPVPTRGCGSAAAASGRFTIDVAGSPREYILALPDDYDPARPYRLIFTWHPGGGSAQGTANNYYGLRQLAGDSAIFVSPEGIDEGWANTDGRDTAFLDAMLERFAGELCFDQSRVFSTGFSYGGMMSFAIGCGRADVFRAIAPMSGALFSGCEQGDTPIAMLGFHGTTDTVVDIAQGVRARDVIVERNGCQPEAEALEADGCLAFQGCSEGHSVTWCEFDGGHMPAPGSAPRIWDFFSQF